MVLFAMIAIVLILFISSITIERYLKENNRQNEEMIKLLNELNNKSDESK
ncbi:hypothetical protein KP77_12000 [Jeotgalibacillus alimentarius]|uniref:Uncharacterized protein n=1 Tax=Jeotgalibacillus alimentarius TaxID=135826 RepID=A0A0C2W6M7_9BACL|nr:hypothetical protein KP77_12000 [Jeotgalibacillus alimentarius]